MSTLGLPGPAAIMDMALISLPSKVRPMLRTRMCLKRKNAKKHFQQKKFI